MFPDRIGRGFGVGAGNLRCAGHLILDFGLDSFQFHVCCQALGNELASECSYRVPGLPGTSLVVVLVGLRIARMMAGRSMTATTRAHASELLEKADR